ncbi:MAG: efflux RND transporter permease subunit [Sphingobacteriales bacterium]|nr:MAG: efflux RND transporter permease subunit [Sphingobacteriales bacterium]
MKDTSKEFFASSWSIDNRTSIYVLTVIITLAGIFSYINIPKERFPDIIIPTIYVSTIYPGASPADMENLVTKKMEKRIKSINGVKKVTSNSIQDFSNIIIEFNTGIDVAVAKQKVKDEVDKSKPDLPSDLKNPPTVQEIDFSEMPIMFINLSGNYDLNKLKKYADMLKDRVEGMKEITRVDIVGALNREIQINVDMYKLQSANFTLDDIDRAVVYENMTISGGNIEMDGMKRSLSVTGDFKNVDQIGNIVLRSMTGATLYLKDVAEVKDAFAEKESYARLDHKNVITLNVIKRSGENLINAADNVRAAVDDLEKNAFPSRLKITVTGDQSELTRTTLHDLINTIIIGFILVLVVLMFFMGVTNAFFVALSVPLSVFLAFLVLPTIGFSLNMIVLFSFLLALGIVVDDAIVVIENTHRIFNNGKVPIVKAAKMATGEVFLPVLSGTLTTLAPFVPLAFWPGIIGKFMFFLPITLIITLLASLAIAYIINPVFAVSFMKPHVNENDPVVKKKRRKSLRITTILLLAFSALFYLGGNIGMGNFGVFLLLLVVLDRFVLESVTQNFMNKVWPRVQNGYKNLITRALKGYRPAVLLIGTFVLMFIAVVAVMIRKPAVETFPQGEPHFAYVYVNMPVGTHQSVTDSITRLVEQKVYKVIGEHNPIVESVISNVAVGATDPSSGDRSVASNKGKVTVAFVDIAKRNGASSKKVLDSIRAVVKGIPGVQITVDKEANGPPVGKPINIEIGGDDFDELITTSQGMIKYLDSLQIPGVEELKSDLIVSKPEVVIDIDRERANREGISTGQIGMALRTALYGKEVSKYKEANDEYPIMLRLNDEQRNNITELLNLKITYRDMNMGGAVRSVPLSSVASVRYTNTYGGITRKNGKRVVTVYSNILSDFNPQEVVANVTAAAANYKIPKDQTINLTGEQEQQKETGAFLGNAMLTSILMMVLILVIQFNSFGKTIIILSEIFFSIIGVLLGIAITGMAFSVVMTGVGIVALAGIVVRNGILIIEFTDLLRSQGMEVKEAIIEAGRTRMTPVILTATATMLGLLPLAVGMNIDFVTLFTELNPHIWFGGDSVAFWGPLSWTIIFGLSFATFISLFLVPAMYLIGVNVKNKFSKKEETVTHDSSFIDIE